jgi:hypothetical protein
MTNNMNNIQNNNCAMPGLDRDLYDYFDFDAASSHDLWSSTHNNPVGQTQTVEAEEETHVIPLTQSEIETILALRASRSQNYQHPQGLAPRLTNNDITGFKDSSANGASFNNTRTDSLVTANCNNSKNLDIPDYGTAPMNTFDGFGAWEYKGIEAPVEDFEASTDFVPTAVGQLE